MSKKQKNYTHKISISANVDSNMVKLGYSPSLKNCTMQDHQAFVNITLAAANMGLSGLLQALPLLRPASDAEREAQVYVFKNEQSDNKLYNERKAMYNTIAGVFQETLTKIFPDVEYVDNCVKNQQEKIFDMSKEEAEEYQEELAILTESIRNPKEEE